jgi:DNA polymerase I-like protein with 3'-5' exonuclease and polymerase domains
MLTVKNPKNFDWANLNLVDCCKGNALDAYFTLKLYNLIEKRLDDIGVMGFVEKVLMPSVSLFSEMELEGLDIDKNELSKVGKIISDKNIDDEDKLFLCKGVEKTDNLASNDNLIEILYTREEGLGLYPPDKTAKGKPSVSAPTLKILLEHVNEELGKRE